MQYTLRSLVLSLLLATSLSAIPGGNFSSEDWLAGSGQSGTGLFTITDGRLVFTAGPTGLHNTAQMLPTPGAGGNLVGYLNQSWSVQVETHIADFGALNAGLPVTPRQDGEGVHDPAAQGFMAQLAVNSAFHNGGKGLYVQAGYDYLWGQSVQASSGGWGFDSGYHGVEMVGNTLLLRAAYDAPSFTLTGSVSFDEGATWLPQSQTQFDVRATGDAGWGLSGDFAGPAFVIMLNGSAHNLAVTGMDMTFNHFTSTGLSAVPEPSTYAAIAGFAALGLAIWRKRRKEA